MSTDLRRWMMLCEGLGHESDRSVLAPLAKAIRGRSYEAAKRAIVAKVGSVRPGERFDDDVADAVFLRLQRTAQIGQNTSEIELKQLGRDAKRLQGDGDITLYRAAPKGGSIRPGDFATDDPEEAKYYLHGGNVVQSLTVPLRDVITLRGTMGGGQEFVYLPADYEPPTPVQYFDSFRDFYDYVVRS